VFEVSYVGTHGVGLFQSINDNFFTGPLVNGFSRSRTVSGVTTTVNFPSFLSLLPPGTVAQVCTNDPATVFVDESVCNGRLKRQAGITVRANTAQSIYHSMQARYAGRFMKNALSLNAAYTFSHTIDNASEIFAFADIGSANAQNPFCINSCERANSNLNRPHAFAMSFIYDVPFMKEQHGFVGHLLGGWQINGVQVITSGNPYTPAESTNGVYGLGATYLTSGDRPFVGNPNADPRQVGISQIDAFFTLGAPTPTNLNGFYNLTTRNQTGQWVAVSPNDVNLIINGPGAAKIFGTPFGTMPRNYLRGPAINQLNASLFKNIKIGERVKLQLQGTAINVLNHPNPGYGTNANPGANGYLPSIVPENAGKTGVGFAEFKDINLARRVVQFGLRIIF